MLCVSIANVEAFSFLPDASAEIAVVDQDPITDIVDEVKNVSGPSDLLNKSEILIMLLINLFTYLAGFFGFLKNVKRVYVVVVGIAVILGGGFIAFGGVTFWGALKAYVFSTSFYELVLKHAFGKSKEAGQPKKVQFDQNHY